MSPSTSPSAPPSFSSDASVAVGKLAAIAAESTVAVFCQNPGELQLGELLSEFGSPGGRRHPFHRPYLHRGFVWTTRS